jgi:hypothetical protein
MVSTPAMSVEHQLETVDAALERFGIGCGMARFVGAEHLGLSVVRG